MRVLIIRHGDPNYETDSLTELGKRQAELLGERLAKEHVTHAYVSPLHRAQLTAVPFLERAGMEATELEWLREFPAGLPEAFAYQTKYGEHNRCPWNMPPAAWSTQPEVFSPDGWRSLPMFVDGGIVERFDFVTCGWDALMAEHGYTRDDSIYHIAEGWEEKQETIALFCHLGLGTALMAHIMQLSLPAVWHSLFMPVTSVTTVFMEQHLDAPCAHARLVQVGDTSHLYAGGMELPARGLFAASVR